MFDQLVRTLPDEASTSPSVKQSDKRLELKGMAQSSTRVSSFMRNIDGSEWLDKPELEIGRDARACGARRSSSRCSPTRSASPDDASQTGAAKASAAAGARQ